MTTNELGDVVGRLDETVKTYHRDTTRGLERIQKILTENHVRVEHLEEWRGEHRAEHKNLTNRVWGLFFGLIAAIAAGVVKVFWRQ